jgi:hypothetical protein
VKDSWEDTDADHGRITSRTCAVIEDLEMIPAREKWPGLRTIARVDSEVYHKATGQQSSMTRYFITTLQADARTIALAARAHWGI